MGEGKLKKMFLPFIPQFSLKIGGGGFPPTWIHHCNSKGHPFEIVECEYALEQSRITSDILA